MYTYLSLVVYMCRRAGLDVDGKVQIARSILLSSGYIHITCLTYKIDNITDIYTKYIWGTHLSLFVSVCRRAGLDTHGLGKVRSMDDWVQWSGIDFKDPSHVAAGDKFCRDVTDLPMDKSRVCPISSEAKAKFAQSG